MSMRTKLEEPPTKIGSFFYKKITLLLTAALAAALVSCFGSPGNEDISNGTLGLRVTVVSGDNQAVKPGEEFSNNLMIQVSAEDTGTPVNNISIEYSETTSTGAVLSRKSDVTNTEGRSSLRVTAPSEYGTPISIQAKIRGGSSGTLFSVRTYRLSEIFNLDLNTTHNKQETAGCWYTVWNYNFSTGYLWECGN
jgi:hypothetical protein